MSLVCGHVLGGLSWLLSDTMLEIIEYQHGLGMGSEG